MDKIQLYALYLDGEFYGLGGYDYVQELLRDYIYIKNLYGKGEIKFKVRKIEKLSELETLI